MKIFLLTGFAGFAGTLLRYFCTKLINSFLPGYPWGTLAVNIAGAFLAGFFFIFLRTRFQQYEAYFPILFIGFLGAFTTFSTFALESIRFFADEQYGKFFLNILLQNGTGLLAAMCGFLLAAHFTR